MSKIKEYTVKDFYEKYTSAKSDEVKNILLQSVIKNNYVAYEEKVAICDAIVNATYYMKETINGIETKKLHINSPAQHMHYCLWIIKTYTYIKIDFTQSLEDFNLLNKFRLIDTIFSMIDETELKEFRMILDMVTRDVIQNEYEPYAFVANQVERFGKLFGTIAKPSIDKLGKAIENIDENIVNKILSSIDGLKKQNI